MKEMLKKKNMSVYELSRRTNIPYTTLNELVRGNKSLKNCSVKILKALSQELHMTMDEIYNVCEKTSYMDFEVFKSNEQHRLKEKGSVDYLIYVLETDIIHEYWKKGRRVEALYMTCLYDYISEKCHMEKYNGYDEIRKYKLEEPLYPVTVQQGLESKSECEKLAIPIFKQHGIMEVDVFNVC